MKCPKCCKSKYDTLIRGSHEKDSERVCWDCLSDGMKKYYISAWFPFKTKPLFNKDVV